MSTQTPPIPEARSGIEEKKGRCVGGRAGVFFVDVTATKLIP